MALIKVKDLKQMNEATLISKKTELEKELMKIRTQISTGTMPKNPGETRETKRTIARINTILKTKSHIQKEEINTMGGKKKQG